MIGDDLFSIDTAAHLRKVAAHTFRFPAYYPVELVRAARRRGASCVDIVSRRGRMEIRDDGDGLPEPELAALEQIFRSDVEAEVREAAIDSFATATGIGLLAAFALPAERVEMETRLGEAGRRLVFGGGRPSAETIAPPPRTLIRIVIPGHDWKAEHEAIRLFCRFAAPGLFLNGFPAGGGMTLPRSLASLPLRRGPEVRGVIGIPESGHLSRLWLLDNGVCWNWHSLAARSGLVWEAVLEADSEVDEKTLEALDESARRLLVWLAERERSFPEPQRRRIEELVFDRLRKAGDEQLADVFKPFAIAGRNLNLAELRQRAEGGGLAFHLDNDAPAQAGEVLRLTQQQADFLLNDLKWPLPRLQPLPARFAARSRLLRAGRRLAAALAPKLPRLERICAEAELNPPERLFLERIQDCARPGSPEVSGSVPLCRMVPGRWGSPATLLAGGSSPLLLFRRQHRLVRKAVGAVVTDAGDAEVALAALVPGWANPSAKTTGSEIVKPK